MREWTRQGLLSLGSKILLGPSIKSGNSRDIVFLRRVSFLSSKRESGVCNVESYYGDYRRDESEALIPVPDTKSSVNAQHYDLTVSEQAGETLFLPSQGQRSQQQV